MILHVTFSDGSNPWASFSADQKTIAKQWRRWMKYHRETAQPVAIAGGFQLQASTWSGGYFITSDTGGAIPRQYYKTLGRALAALERLGGERN